MKQRWKSTHWVSSGKPSDGVEKSEEKAENCYKIGVEYEIPEASLSLGKLYLRGINGARPNPRKARRALENASDEGSAEAASLLGKMYDEGIMGKVNPDRAFNYYLLAAERGDSSAMLMTGMFYAQGESARKDLTAAEMWIRKAGKRETLTEIRRSAYSWQWPAANTSRMKPRKGGSLQGLEHGGRSRSPGGQRSLLKAWHRFLPCHLPQRP